MTHIVSAQGAILESETPHRGQSVPQGMIAASTILFVFAALFLVVAVVGLSGGITGYLRGETCRAGDYLCVDLDEIFLVVGALSAVLTALFVVLGVQMLRMRRWAILVYLIGSVLVGVPIIVLPLRSALGAHPLHGDYLIRLVVVGLLLAVNRLTLPQYRQAR